jgi:hypothetical protein
MSFLVRATMISLTRNLTYLLTPDLSQQHRFSSARSSSDALNRNKTKSLTFSADISHGLRDAMPGPRRYRLKLTMSVPANSRAERLLRRPSSDRRRLAPYRRPS